VEFQKKARLYSYQEAANPVRPGLTEPIRPCQWPASIHGPGPTALIPLEPGPQQGLSPGATSPGLAAAFLRINAGESLPLTGPWASAVFYALSGSGELTGSLGGEAVGMPWGPRDAFVLPPLVSAQLRATGDALLYAVHDGPLLSYLGVVPGAPRFGPAHYAAPELEQKLQAVAADPGAAKANRVSILLGHADLPATRTVSHTLWAMLGIVPPGAVQPPHRHQSVALDLIIDCSPGTHTLTGPQLDADGLILNPHRIDWQPAGAFLTPPGWWHSHVNPTDTPARLLPVQDAGLHSYLRSLDIQFR